MLSKNVWQHVKDHTTISFVGPNGKHFSFQPGNGMKYEILVIPISNFGMGNLGAVDNGYLVIHGHNAKAQLFQAEGWLAKSYVAEHMLGDYSNDEFTAILTALLGYAMNRPTDVDDIKEFGPMD